MLKKDEWTYLLNTRSVSHVRYHIAVVSGVNGVILYSDAYTPFAAGAPTVYSGGTVTDADWRKMQLQGCVFIPQVPSPYYWTETSEISGSQLMFTAQSGYDRWREREGSHYKGYVRYVTNL